MTTEFIAIMLWIICASFALMFLIGRGAIKTKQETDARIALIDRELQRRAEQAAE